MKLLQFNENSKRLTWRLTPEVHAKMAKIGKASGLTQEELGNVILGHIEWDDVKTVINSYMKEKKKAEDAKKKTSETLSQLSPELLDKMSNMSSEDIAKLLG